MRAGGQPGDEDLPTSHRAPHEKEWTLKLCHGPKKPMPAHNNSKQLRNSLLLLSLFFPYLSHTLEEQGHLVSVWLEVSSKGSKADRSSNQKRKEADWPFFPQDRLLVCHSPGPQLWLQLMDSMWIIDQAGHINYWMETVSSFKWEKYFLLCLSPQREFAREVMGCRGECLLILPSSSSLTVTFRSGIGVA